MNTKSIAAKIHIPLILSIIAGLTIVIISSMSSISNIQKEVYGNTKKELAKLYQFKINAKEKVGLTNALNIANNLYVIEGLKTNNRDLTIKGLKHISDTFKKFTNFKNIKIHVHTKDVHSFVRLWKLSKYGDDLSGFRNTVLYVKKYKKPVVAIELGRAGMVLRGLAPVMEDGKYLGSVEFMQGLNSVSKELLKDKIYLLITLDKKYLHIATNDGLISIKILQAAGKKKMNIEDFLRGNKINL